MPKPPSPLPILIFDFDGTIADTFTPTIDILRTDYLRWGDRFHRTHTINQLRSLTISEIIHTIPGGWWKFVYLLLKAKYYLRTHPQTVLAYPGIVYTLRTLYDQGYQLYIVTSNNVTTVRRFLRHYSLEELFIAIYPTRGLWRKATTLRQVCARHHLAAHQVLYIGDEIRDIQACRDAGLPIVSVAYGYNSLAGLQKYQPDFIIKKPTQLLQLLHTYSLPSQAA